MDAYDFIKLYKGDFSGYFPKCKCFVLHTVFFFFSIIALKIPNVHKFLPLKTFSGCREGGLKVRVKRMKSLISHESFQIYCQGKITLITYLHYTLKSKLAVFQGVLPLESPFVTPFSEKRALTSRCSRTNYKVETLT